MVAISIEKDEAGYYVAEVPALPGCVSQGNTREEAIANIREAIEGWFEVMEQKVKDAHIEDAQTQCRSGLR